MPTNLTKVYNQLLELLYQSTAQNLQSLRRVFDRDFCNGVIHSRNIPGQPTPSEGEDTMDRLFRHLTTVVTNEATRQREFESERSIRLHWIRHHLEEKSPDKLLVFLVEDENRIYLLDKAERYVVVLEPLRKVNAYYLLTAYRLLPANLRKL